LCDSERYIAKIDGIYLVNHLLTIFLSWGRLDCLVAPASESVAAEELSKLELDKVGIAEHLMSWLDWLRAVVKLVGRELLLLLGLQINLSVSSGLVQLLQYLKYLLGCLIVVLH
jgi:hypothetical protein